MTNKEFNTLTMLAAYCYFNESDKFPNLSQAQGKAIHKWLTNVDTQENGADEMGKRLESKVRAFANNLLKENKQ